MFNLLLDSPLVGGRHSEVDLIPVNLRFSTRELLTPLENATSQE